jgi:uncharacterized Zn-binding protein involved in type VI secretion
MPFAAKEGDLVQALDTHIVLIPAGPDLVPTPEELPFNGPITSGCSTNVKIEGRPAAILGCGAVNEPPHIPVGGEFENPPTNTGKVITGSATVLINDTPAVRAGDTAETCNDPGPLPVGTVIVPASTVQIGG